MIDRLTEVIATCDNESIYGTASALIKIRDELEKSGEIKHPDALDYFAKTRLESLILTKLGKYEDLEKELNVDLINDKERMIFIKAILKGYIYFKDHENKVHKGYIVGYEENFAFYKRKLIVAYGIGLHFNWRDDLWIYDDEELMKNPYNHPLGKRAYGSCLIKKEYDLDYEHFGTTWALTKEELL